MRKLNESGFRRSLEIQRRVVGALLLREVITRYGRHNVGFLWLFLEPMLFTLGIAALWSATKATHGSQLPIVPFAVTGYSSVLLWRNGANRCANAVEPNKALLFHRNVRVLDFFAARLCLEIAGATTSLVVLSSVFIFTGLMSFPSDLLTMILGWAMLAWFATGLGMVIGSISERSEVLDRVWHTITYLIFPFSGSVFMVEWLPKRMQEIALWVPMVNGIEILRDGYYGSQVKAHYSMLYLVFVNVALTLLGLALVRDIAKRVEGE